MTKVSLVSCEFDAIKKEDGNQFTHVVDHDVTINNMVSDIKQNVSTTSAKKHLRLGDDVHRNLTFDNDGNPLVTVDPMEIYIQNALLMEHDERFHDDPPGMEN